MNLNYINGFINNGNTCYLNSTLQLIFNIKEINEYFINKKFLEEINNNFKNTDFKKNKEHKNNLLFIQNYYSLLNDYHNNNNKILNPKKLLNSIQNLNSYFKGNNQHDSQEILLLILDYIHENLKYNVDINYHGNPKNNTDKLVIESINALIKILDYKYSIINELFYGMYYTQFKSIEDNSYNKIISKKYDHFNNLTLEFDGNNLNENLDIFFKDENLDSKLFNEKDKNMYNVCKSLKIINSPKYLFITLKKYNYNNSYNNSNNNINNYTFPIFNLDFSKYCLGYDSYQCSYDLLGAICHQGSLNFGHYLSIINKNDTWYIINDEDVKIFNIEKNKDFLFKNAYVLLYIKNKNN